MPQCSNIECRLPTGAYLRATTRNTRTIASASATAEKRRRSGLSRQTDADGSEKEGQGGAPTGCRRSCPARAQSDAGHTTRPTESRQETGRS